jgi:hypothetical protein
VSDSEVELIIYENEDIDKYLLNWETLYNGLPNLPSQYEKPKIITMKQWDSILIPIGLRHTAKSLINNAVIIECSTFHQDSDSYRILKGD